MAKNFGDLAKANSSSGKGSNAGAAISSVSMRKHAGLEVGAAEGLTVFNLLSDPEQDWGVLSVTILRIYEESVDEVAAIVPVIANNAVVRPNAGLSDAGVVLPESWTLERGMTRPGWDRENGFFFMMTDGSVFHVERQEDGVEMTAWINYTAFRDLEVTPLHSYRLPVDYQSLRSAFEAYDGGKPEAKKARAPRRARTPRPALPVEQPQEAAMYAPALPIGAL